MRRLGVHVRLAIAGKALSQGPLEGVELTRGGCVSPEVVSESKIVPPQGSPFYNQVQMVGARVAAAEELSARDPSLAAVLVARLRERGDVVLNWSATGPARGYVENRLAAHSWDGGAAHVFEAHGQRAAVRAYPQALSLEERRPSSVVLGEANNSRLETKRVSHSLQALPSSRTEKDAATPPQARRARCMREKRNIGVAGCRAPLPRFGSRMTCSTTPLAPSCPIDQRYAHPSPSA
jgi:hypothetical protein